MIKLAVMKGLFIKFKSHIILGFTLGMPFSLIEFFYRWWATNQEYVTFVFFAISIDHALGSIVHKFFKKDFTIKANAKGLLTKTGLVVLVGLLFEGVGAIIVKESFITAYILTVLRLIVFLYPAGSAFRNSSILSGGKFPPKSWIDRITNFENNLKVEDLTGKKEKNESEEN